MTVRTRKGEDGILRAAVVDGILRPQLSRTWSDAIDIRYLTWWMSNPSKADALQDDPTLGRITKWSQRWGYGGLLVVNDYPFRSPSPADARAWYADGGYTDALRGYNQEHIRACLHRSLGHVVAAWGNLSCHEGSEREQRFKVESDMSTLHGIQLKWQALGTTLSGSPKHPMARGKSRVPDDVIPIDYNPHRR